MRQVYLLSADDFALFPWFSSLDVIRTLTSPFLPASASVADTLARKVPIGDDSVMKTIYDYVV